MSQSTLAAIERCVAIRGVGHDFATIAMWAKIDDWELESALLRVPETDEEQTVWLSVEHAELLKEAAEALEIKLHVEVLA